MPISKADCHGRNHQWNEYQHIWSGNYCNNCLCARRHNKIVSFNKIHLKMSSARYGLFSGAYVCRTYSSISKVVNLVSVHFNGCNYLPTQYTAAIQRPAMKCSLHESVKLREYEKYSHQTLKPCINDPFWEESAGHRWFHSQRGGIAKSVFTLWPPTTRVEQGMNKHLRVP